MNTPLGKCLVIPFYVTHKSNIIENNNIGNGQFIPRFTRVCVIKLSSTNHLSCSCGYCQRWLMPCNHICSLISNIELYTIDLFHIKWWKHFNFLYKLGKSNKDIKTRSSLHSALIESREKDFHSDNGKFKGVPLTGTPLLDHLTSMDISSNSSDDKLLRFMKKVLDMNKSNICICKNTNAHKESLLHYTPTTSFQL